MPADMKLRLAEELLFEGRRTRSRLRLLETLGLNRTGVLGSHRRDGDFRTCYGPSAGRDFGLTKGFRGCRFAPHTKLSKIEDGSEGNESRGHLAVPRNL